MPTLFAGGSERQVRYIIEGIEKAGLNVIVLVENGSREDEHNKSFILAHKKVKFFFFEQQMFSEADKNKVNKLKSLSFIAFWILRNGKRENVKWAMFTNLTGLALVPICRSMKIKVLFNERNPGIKMCNNPAKRICLKMCNKVVSNSKSASAYMSKILKRKVECINNGLEVPESISNQEKIGIFTILVPARITKIKNQMLVVKAICILQGKLEFKVMFAGQAEDDKYVSEIKEYIRKYKLEEHVSLLGYVSDMRKLYNMASLIILPSYEEGTPNVILEAYMYRKLCLASDIVMNRDIACDSRILFDMNNPEKLAEKIMWIKGLDESKKTEMIETNYQFVRNNYNLSVMQCKYIEVFSCKKSEAEN